MPKVKDFDKTMIEIWDRYNSDPSNWVFLEMDTDRKDRIKMYFSDGEDTWYIDGFVTSNNIKGKGILFPGKDIHDFADISNPKVSSGLRLLDKEKLIELMQKGDFSGQNIMDLMDKVPTRTENIDNNKLGVFGPNYVISRDKLRLSEVEKETLRKLRCIVDGYERNQLRYIG